ncbi:unnamed protein product [Effrenium voratum]|nr:unnamed protein product [Effrenium voratum]
MRVTWALLLPFAWSQEEGLCLLQRQVRRVHGGCDPSESFEGAEPPKEGVAKVLQKIPEGSANPWHTSICSRTRRILDHLEAAVGLQEETCAAWGKKPESVLSFGCSVGIELEEALHRFPGARVMGYDLDSGVVEKAKKRLKSRAQVVSDYGQLPAEGFDLVLANNLLYNGMPEGQFQRLLEQLLQLLRPGGILELMVYSQRVKPPSSCLWCEGFQFNSSMAWQVIRERFASERPPERSCGLVTVPSVQGSTLFVYRRPSA